MFSTASDRFFHGANKRNKQMITTSGIKIGQSPSRERRNSVTRSKMNKLFETSTASLKNSINEVMWGKQTSDFQMKTERNDFAPPVPYKEPPTFSRAKKKNLSKTSTKFSPSIQTHNLQSLLEQRFNNEKTKAYESIDELSPSVEEKIKEAKKENLIMLYHGSKVLCKKKPEEIRKYSNMNRYQGSTKTERVEDKQVKRLIEIMGMRKGGNVTNRSSNRERGESFEQSELSIQQKNEHLEEKKSLINSRIIEKIRDSEIESVNPTTQRTFSVHRTNRESPSKLQIEKTIREEPISRPTQKVFPLHDSKESDRIDQEESYEENTINFNVQLSNLNIESNLKNKEKVLDQNNAELEERKAKNSKTNNFWNQNLIEIPKINEVASLEKEKESEKYEKPPRQNKNSPKKQTEVLSTEKSKEIDSEKNKAGQNQVNKKNSFKRLEEDLEDLEEIDLGKNSKQKVEEKVSQKTVDNKKQIKPEEQKKESNKSVQEEKWSSGPKKVIVESQKIVDDAEEEEEFEDEDIMQEFTYYIGLIDDLGQYCRETKKFYETTKIDLPKDYLLMCFYMWHQLYYLRQCCIDWLRSKNKSWYEITVKMMRRSSLVSFFDSQLKKLTKEHKKCEETLNNYLSQARVLQDSLKIDSSVNNHEKCLSLLQKEFKEIEKIWRQAVQSRGKNEKFCMEKLCRMIELFNNLKYLNGEDVDDLEEFGEETDRNKYYANYKHLIVL